MENQNDLKIVGATIEDAPVITSIYNEHIEIGISSMEVGMKPIEEIEGWFKNFHSRELIILLKKSGNTIGWGIIKRYSDRRGYDRTCETAVYLTESETGKGYGPIIKKALIQKCKDLNYHHLVAKIFADNEGSINYNLKMGYKIVGTQKEVGFKNNKYLDITIMQLLLQD